MSTKNYRIKFNSDGQFDVLCVFVSLISTTIASIWQRLLPWVPISFWFFGVRGFGRILKLRRFDGKVV